MHVNGAAIPPDHAAIVLRGTAIVLRGTAIVLRGSAIVLRGSAVVGEAVVGEAVVGEAALPNLRDEVRAAEYPGRMRDEEGQEFELLEGQRDLAAAGPDPALHMIQEQA